MYLALTLAGVTGFACAAGPPGGKGADAARRPARVVASAGLVQAAAALSGRVMMPASLIGNHGGGLVSDQGSSLVGNHGAGLISDRGGSARAFSLAQAIPQVPVASAVVALADATGEALRGPDGGPVTAVTDAEGRFAFPALPRDRALVATCRLPGQAGRAAALVPRVTREAALDLGSTLTAEYILQRYARSQADPQAALERLPEGLARAAQAAAVEATTAGLLPSRLDADAATRLVEVLRGSARKLDAVLDEVRAVMTLAGVDQCQDRATAATVALAKPLAVAAAPDGSVFVSEEAVWGRVLRVASDGAVSVLFGPCGRDDRVVPPVQGLAVGGDGRLYLSSAGTTGLVWACRPDGTNLQPFAGGGTQRPSVGGQALEMRLTRVFTLATAPGGGCWLAVQPEAEAPCQLLRVDTAGIVQAVQPGPETTEVEALAVSADGALWLTDGVQAWLLEPGQAWRTIVPLASNRKLRGLLALPDGAVLMSVRSDAVLGPHALERVDRAGTATRWAGAGPAGLERDAVARAQAHFAWPNGLALASDGSVLVADAGNAVVRRITPDGLVGVAVGALVAPASVPREARLNQPISLVVDGRGRPVILEQGAFALRRLEEARLMLIAGGRAGPIGDGARVKAETLEVPHDLAVLGEDLLVADDASLRRLYANGEIASIAGGGSRVPGEAKEALQAREARFWGIYGVVVDPQGRPVFGARVGTRQDWSMSVFRLEPDGALTLLAGDRSRMPVGPDDREGKRAVEVPFGSIWSMAYDAAGQLHMAEVNTCIVWRLDAQGICHRVAGLGMLPTALALSEAANLASGRSAREAPLLVPMGLAFDPQGRLAIAELGTRGARNLGRQLGPGVLAGLELLGDQARELDGRLTRVEADGRLTVLAGTGGPAARVPIRSPIDLAYGEGGRLMFLDFSAGQLQELTGLP